MNRLMSSPISTPATTSHLDPIAGVTLEVYAQINVEFSNRGYDPTVAQVMAARRGIAKSSWAEAVAGWNRRIHEHPQVAAEFVRLYKAAAAVDTDSQQADPGISASRC